MGGDGQKKPGEKKKEKGNPLLGRRKKKNSDWKQGGEGKPFGRFQDKEVAAFCISPKIMMDQNKKEQGVSRKEQSSYMGRGEGKKKLVGGGESRSKRKSPSRKEIQQGRKKSWGGEKKNHVQLY